MISEQQKYGKCFVTGGPCMRQESFPIKVDNDAKQDAFPNNDQCPRPDKEEVNPNKVFVIMPFRGNYYDNFIFGIEEY